MISPTLKSCTDYPLHVLRASERPVKCAYLSAAAGEPLP